MKIRSYENGDEKELINLIGNFRVRLSHLKGIEKKIDLKSAKTELEYYIKKEYPIFIAEDDKNTIVGYHVCRVEDEIVWSESLYVIPENRRKGIGSGLYEEAEKFNLLLETAQAGNGKGDLPKQLSFVEIDSDEIACNFMLSIYFACKRASFPRIMHKSKFANLFASDNSSNESIFLSLFSFSKGKMILSRIVLF